ncbi:MAG: transporter substrate-binding protein [Myxococcales bacterium]|nr:transporter substrate-binding protein [Myxococcales bacterium]
MASETAPQPRPDPAVTAESTGSSSLSGESTDAGTGLQPVDDVRIGRLFGKYRILRRIGRGGMATVYEAEDLALKRTVAVKFLAESLLDRPNAVERFMREAQVAGRLSHPNIIAIYDVCKDSGSCYMVMEFVNPESAGQRVRSVGPYYWLIATRIMADCCSALKVAHAAGLIHRDIKPDNILFSSAGTVRLTDFGIVKTLEDDPHLTAAGHVVGTPLYMSPEQSYDSRTVDARSDIYSLGATYFALLTGRPPFQGHTVLEIMSHVRSSLAPDPRDFISEIPEPCARVILRALSKEPAARYQSAGELLGELESILDRVPRRQQSIFEMERELPRPRLNRMQQGSLGSSQDGHAQPGSWSPPAIPQPDAKAQPGPAPQASASHSSDANKVGSGEANKVGSSDANKVGSGEANKVGSGDVHKASTSDASKTTSVQTEAPQPMRRWLLAVVGLSGLVLGMLPWLRHRLADSVLPGLTGSGGVTAAAGSLDAGSKTDAADVSNVKAPPAIPPIKVGILHSLTGPLAISERPLADAADLAIEEVNEQGGVLNRKLEPVVLDGKSEVTSDSAFARAAKRLIHEDKVAVVFGGFGSAGRKTITPYFVEADILLFYPASYEGLEESPNVVYTGAIPNQFVIPAVQWLATQGQVKRVFLIGTDGLRPRAIEAIVEEEARKLRWKLAGSYFALVGEVDFSDVIKKIARAKPQLILSALVGDSNVTFIKQLHAAKLLPSKVPTLSFALSEIEIAQLGDLDLSGHYITRAHFPQIEAKPNPDSEGNKPVDNTAKTAASPDNEPAAPAPSPQPDSEFARRFHRKYGEHRVVSDGMEAAYYGVHLWAQAVRAAGSENTRAVRQVLRQKPFELNDVRLRVDPSNQHTWKTLYVARIGEKNQTFPVFKSPEAFPPIPFPGARTRAEWNVFLDDLYKRWGNNWANPLKPSYGSAK